MKNIGTWWILLVIGSPIFSATIVNASPGQGNPPAGPPKRRLGVAKSDHTGKTTSGIGKRRSGEEPQASDKLERVDRMNDELKKEQEDLAKLIEDLEKLRNENDLTLEIFETEIHPQLAKAASKLDMIQKKTAEAWEALKEAKSSGNET